MFYNLLKMLFQASAFIAPVTLSDVINGGRVLRNNTSMLRGQMG